MEERVARLERSVRRQRALLVALAGALVAALCLGAGEPVQDEVRCRKLVIDNGGPVQLVADPAGLAITDGKDLLASLSADKASAMVLLGGPGQPTIALRTQQADRAHGIESWGSIELDWSRGHPAFWAIASPGYKALTADDRTGKRLFEVP